MQLKDSGSVCLAYFDGEINLSTIHAFKDDLYKLEAEVNKNVVLNLNNVLYINSVGLGAIIELYKKLKAEKRTVQIVCNAPMVREVFDIVKINKIIPIFNSDDEVI